MHVYCLLVCGADTAEALMLLNQDQLADLSVAFCSSLQNPAQPSHL